MNLKMMGEIVKPLANLFEVDISTMWKSIFSGTSSTGLGIYIARINNINWNFELNMISLCWGVLSAIILTLVSLSVSDLYKFIKKSILVKKEKRVGRKR
jgi:hypothetical protein